MDYLPCFLLIILGVLYFISKVQTGIGCFVCYSLNGSDPNCSDPFHPAKADYYNRFCRSTMKNHIGYFPAKYCTKIKGVNKRTNKEILVRSCDLQALDNACSTFNFENDLYYGCLMSCHTHGCNVAPSILHTKSQTALTVISTALVWTIAHRLGTPI